MINNMHEVDHTPIENTAKFRKPAITFKKYGYYVAAPPGTSEYMNYWNTETLRCLEGFTADDGDFISGYMYFYLNYSPIMIVEEKERTGRTGNKRIALDRVKDFPNYWDSDKQFFDAVEQAEEEGNHLAVLKARGKGYSFKTASMLNRNFFLIPGSTSYAIASEKEFLVKDGILSKAWEMMNFVNQHTAWYKKRQGKDTEMHKRASIIMDNDGKKVETGYMSEIIGITLKNDIQKARGKRGKLILWEEAGKFPGLLDAWQIARPSVEQGDSTYGLMIAFGTGGCVCAGTKVWDNRGNLCNIEDLKQEQGILGFDKYSNEVSQEDITYIQDIIEKPCYKITTNTDRQLEASNDHPILTAIQEREIRGNIIGKKFTAVDELLVGNKIAIIDTIPYFSNKDMWNPRVVGWLIGDGTYGNKQTPRLSNCEIEINDYIENNFNHKVILERKTKLGKIYKEINIKKIIPELRKLGIYGQTKLDKKLPIDIHSYSYESLKEFIGGLFDTDGYVSLRKNKKRNTPIAEISISQASKELLEELRLLLQKFGIHGRIRERLPRENNPKDKNSWFEFTIADKKSLINFASTIKLFPKEKQDRLDKILKVYSNISPHINYQGIRYEEVKDIEYIGIKEVYNLTANNTNTYIANGIITHNTEEGDFGSLKELFYAPKAYNLLPIRNVWDTGADTSSCGFFIPEYMNLEGFMDENGNSYIEEAKKNSIERRREVEEHANDRHAIDRYIAERPMNPMEATLQLTGNIFPKKELAMQVARIQSNEKLKNYKQVGELLPTAEGKLKWVQTSDAKDVIKYPLDKKESKTGAIVIWEHPEDDPPHGLYVAGCDPYDHDDSGTGSLGSTFIYKRFQNFEEYYDVIVAEYTGRPDTADEYYENVKNLLLYYNAKLLYENERKGLFAYFAVKHYDYLLADQPDLIGDIVKDSKVKRRKGIHMVDSIKSWGEREIKDWLNEEYAPGKKNLTKIMSVPLLQELIAYNDRGNFDRVMALMMVMIYKKELHNVHVKKKEDVNKIDPFFSTPLFPSSRTLKFNLR